MRLNGQWWKFGHLAAEWTPSAVVNPDGGWMNTAPCDWMDNGENSAILLRSEPRQRLQTLTAVGWIKRHAIEWTMVKIRSSWCFLTIMLIHPARYRFLIHHSPLTIHNVHPAHYQLSVFNYPFIIAHSPLTIHNCPLPPDKNHKNFDGHHPLKKLVRTSL